MIWRDLTALSPPAALRPGDSFIGCNLQAAQPHTPFAIGVSGLQFRDCNLINRDLAQDATIGPNCLHFHEQTRVVMTRPAQHVIDDQITEADGGEPVVSSAGYVLREVYEDGELTSFEYCVKERVE